MAETQSAQPLEVRNISDTARWAAYFRAQETKRSDAIFRDPYAERLCGQHGVDIANTLPDGNKHAWAWVTRTYLFDHFITQELQRGVDLVLNLAAGLDARPYRMKLPASLQWIEVDLPDLLAYKTRLLTGERPVCALERIPLDLSNGSERRTLFERVASRAKKVLILSEGLLIYLTADEVGALARDLAANRTFERWIVDLASPGLLQLLQRRMGAMVSEAGAPYKFAPPEGPAFFERYGWKPIDVQSVLDAAARARRLPLFLRLMSILPQPKGRRRIWSGVCLLQRLQS